MRESIGLVPDVAVGLVNGILAGLAAPTEADAARAAQDAAAETGDVPRSDVTAAAADVAVVDPDPVIDSTTSEYELRRILAAHPSAVMRTRAEEELTRRELELAIDDVERDETGEPTEDGPPPEDYQPAGPPAGTVHVEELPQDPAKRIAVLRAAGCTCPAPLEAPHDDACVIAGHGIPF
jgi:hypothetical protein